MPTPATNRQPGSLSRINGMSEDSYVLYCVCDD